MICGDGRDAQIDRLARDLHLNTAILREAFLGDAHGTGHDLEPADDGGLQAFRRRLHFLEDAIDAKAHAEFFVERLEMNVARAEAMRLDQEHGDEADDRRVGFVAGIELSALRDLHSEIGVVAQPSLQDVGSFVGGAVVFDECLANFLRAAADELDLALQEKAEAVDGVDIERIADRDDQAAVAEADRDDLEAACIFARDLLDHVRGNGFGRKIDPVHLRLRRERARDIGRGDHAVAGEHGDDVGAAVQTGARALDLCACYQPNVLEDPEHIIIVGGQGCEGDVSAWQ